MQGATAIEEFAALRPTVPPVLPPPAPGWPTALPAGAVEPAPDAARDALRRIRAEALFWPAPRAAAAHPAALAFGMAAAARARAAGDGATLLILRGAADLAGVDPARLTALWGPPPVVARWAALGGLAVDGARPDGATALRGLRPVCPWTGEPATLADALEAQAFLRRSALAARGPLRLVGMTAWKRRCLRPFFTGPDGPPRAAGRGADGPGRVLWGVGADPADPARAPLRVEDGLLRSVGLGLRHTPPLSLAVCAGAPYFDATRRTGFEELAAVAAVTPALRARARRLRRRVVALGLTKYNLPSAGALPDPQGREAVLVPGQVAGDASIRLGATTVRDDDALLAAARGRFPDAFIVYKPHPDVATGLRRGAADPARAARLADHVETRASAAQCLDWCARVATITSTMGFEALLRGRAVTTFGRPFYAGWGLTDDADPPPRDRSLTLDELVALALILHPRYVDPVAGVPAPAEIALRRLVEARAGARLTRAWRDAVSWVLNRL